MATISNRQEADATRRSQTCEEQTRFSPPLCCDGDGERNWELQIWVSVGAGERKGRERDTGKTGI
ncbi:hypothetical protein TIFTF001_013232 [Ficus carica]|uniref:Uncharacterized protein n=1 Tax=Ficus carica TaxID=3494 RepID=A0AA88D4E9_FICCA|nr:hypothetical protein TIFTF001_013232 [Ficus carica]